MAEERKMLDDIKERCLNWFLVYGDFPTQNVSNFYLVQQRLKLYGKQYKQKEETVSPILRKTNPYSRKVNRADADLLQKVWADLDRTATEPLIVGVRFRMKVVPLDVAKKVIVVYVFSGSSYSSRSRELRRKYFKVDLESYRAIEDACLLYFAKQVNKVT